MNFFWIVSAKRLKQFIIIIIAAFFSAGILYIQNTDQVAFSTKNGPRALHKAEESKNEVSLTFNINWGEEKAIPILNSLKQNNIKATFFVSASWAEKHPDILEKIIKDGHEIGSLGYTYKNYRTGDIKKIKKDIAYSKEIFKKLGIKNDKIKLFRPPAGDISKELLNTAVNHGYTVVHWSINTMDDTNPGTKAIVFNVLSNVKAGDIILLHASDSALQTANAIPEIARGLQKKGLKNVRISELISNTEINQAEVK